MTIKIVVKNSMRTIRIRLDIKFYCLKLQQITYDLIYRVLSSYPFWATSPRFTRVGQKLCHLINTIISFTFLLKKHNVNEKEFHNPILDTRSL